MSNEICLHCEAKATRKFFVMTTEVAWLSINDKRTHKPTRIDSETMLRHKPHLGHSFFVCDDHDIQLSLSTV